MPAIFSHEVQQKKTAYQATSCFNVNRSQMRREFLHNIDLTLQDIHKVLLLVNITKLAALLSNEMRESTTVARTPE